MVKCKTINTKTCVGFERMGQAMTSVPSIIGNQPEESGKKKLCFSMPELVCRQKEVHGGKEPRSHVVQ